MLGRSRTQTSEAKRDCHLNQVKREPNLTSILELIHYKSIADQLKHWRDDFEPHWTLDESLRSKKDKLAWFAQLSKIRDRAFHSGNRRLSHRGVYRKFLGDVWVRVTLSTVEGSQKTGGRPRTC